MKQIERSIRREMFKNNRAIRDFLISDREKEYLDFIVICKGCYTQELSEAYSLEIQNACNILRRLHDKKWLSRKRVSNKSHGIRYLYQAITYSSNKKNNVT